MSSSVFLRIVALVFATCLWPTDFAAGQSLLSKLQWNRVVEVASKHFALNGSRMIPKALAPLAVRSDSLRILVYNQLNPPLPQPPPIEVAFLISNIEYVPPERRAATRSRFDNEEWAFLGNTSLLAVDTLLTRDIRGRLQGRFGDPTVTVLEEGILTTQESDEQIQFEYWFLLNDDIPVILIDVNGPWDRGVVMSVPSEFRDTLFDIKESFLGQLSSTEERMPFSDYYYNPDQDQWYVTVFDGASYYDVRIDAPTLSEGRPDLGIYLSSSIRSSQ